MFVPHSTILQSFCSESDIPPMVVASVVMSEPEDDLDSLSVPMITVTATALSEATTKVTITTTTTTYTTSPVPRNGSENMQRLGRFSCHMKCPYCPAQMTTRIQYQVSVVTIVAIVIIVMICWPLFWLPLCLPSCKTAGHYCVNCQSKVGQAEPCT